MTMQQTVCIVSAQRSPLETQHPRYFGWLILGAESCPLKIHVMKFLAPGCQTVVIFVDQVVKAKINIKWSHWDGPFSI